MTTEWKEHTGSDKQITDIRVAKNGVIFRYPMMGQIVESRIIQETEIDKFIFDNYPKEYLIISDDPLREMKIRWAQTGQPVWVKEGIDCMKPFIYETHNPDWNIPNAEYSFKPFED